MTNINYQNPYVYMNVSSRVQMRNVKFNDNKISERGLQKVDGLKGKPMQSYNSQYIDIQV